MNFNSKSMSLSWANKLAKNALLTAQKRIDSVLDIKEANEEEEVVEEEQPISEVESANLSALSDTTEVESNTGNESIKFDPNDESFNTAREENSSNLVDIDLTAEHHTSGWDLSPAEDVVETEPNPIRDAHNQPSTSMLHLSPSSSNSPDEEHQQHSQHHHQPSEHFDLSLINLEQSELPADAVPHITRAKFDRQHEDVITVASSDIVVIKNADDWSIASGSHRRTGSDQASLSAYIHQKSSDDESMHDRVLTLEAKLRHRDQRLEELSRLNESLKSQNTTISQRNKQMSNKLAVESKLQKQLVEKENELKELMNEGKTLSKQNAKQSRELKRLRDIEKEFEVLTLKFNEANEEIERRTDLEIQLKDHLRRVESKLDEKKSEIATIQDKVHQKQELVDDFKMSEQRCQNQKLQIAKLEQRIDELMSAQRESAENIAELNAPLLANIDELENKLRESEAEKYVLQKKIRLAEENVGVATRKSADEINMLKQQLDSLRNSNSSAQEKIRRMKSEYDELNEQHTKVNGLFQSVESKLLTEVAELNELITKKDAEIVELKHELMVATSPKTPASPQKNVTSQDIPPDLLEELHELERENNNLREKFNELHHAHETLLLLHGEGVVRVQELEEENVNIKELCKEQALLVASLNNSSGNQSF